MESIYIYIYKYFNIQVYVVHMYIWEYIITLAVLTNTRVIYS